jgi:hypothetical protein
VLRSLLAHEIPFHDEITVICRCCDRDNANGLLIRCGGALAVFNIIGRKEFLLMNPSVAFEAPSRLIQDDVTVIVNHQKLERECLRAVSRPTRALGVFDRF